jgi:hypothetical protein
MFPAAGKPEAGQRADYEESLQVLARRNLEWCQVLQKVCTQIFSFREKVHVSH